MTNTRGPRIGRGRRGPQGEGCGPWAEELGDRTGVVPAHDGCSGARPTFVQSYDAAVVIGEELLRSGEPRSNVKIIDGPVRTTRPRLPNCDAATCSETCAHVDRALGLYDISRARLRCHGLRRARCPRMRSELGRQCALRSWAIPTAPWRSSRAGARARADDRSTPRRSRMHSMVTLATLHRFRRRAGRAWPAEPLARRLAERAQLCRLSGALGDESCEAGL